MIGTEVDRDSGPQSRGLPTVRSQLHPGASEPASAGWTYVLLKFPPQCRDWPVADELNGLLRASRLVVGIPEVLGVALHACELKRALAARTQP